MAWGNGSGRFAVVLGVVLLVASLLWGYCLRRGLLDGYFTAFPLVPVFFLLVGVFSVRYMRRLVQGGTKRLMTRMSVVAVVRLLVDIAFVAAGLYFIPECRISFVATVLICYTLTLLLSVRALLKPLPHH